VQIQEWAYPLGSMPIQSVPHRIMIVRNPSSSGRPISGVADRRKCRYGGLAKPHQSSDRFQIIRRDSLCGLLISFIFIGFSEFRCKFCGDLSGYIENDVVSILDHASEFVEATPRVMRCLCD